MDWEKTTAWGDGGYYGRLWLNVQGREPQGLIPQEDYEKVRTEIATKLENEVDHQGRPLNNICYKPEDIYHTVRNVPSDLLIYFGNLHWRSVGSLGHGTKGYPVLLAGDQLRGDESFAKCIRAALRS